MPRPDVQFPRDFPGRVPKILAWALAAFFMVGALGNTFPPAPIVENYSRWGYPSWFHYVTGGLELLTALLLALGSTRLVGVVLGSAVMGGAAATLLFHGDFSHAILPLVVLAALLALGATVRRRRG